MILAEPMVRLKAHLRRLLYRDGDTVLPTGIMVLVSTLMLFCSMTLTMVYSFLPKMVKFFGATETSAGTQAGIIAASLYLGAAIMATAWGYVCDKKGKKFSVILCGIGLVLSSLLFGFSTNFYWALVTRLIQGFFLGLEVLLKVIVFDICDDTNTTLGFSFLTTAICIGNMIGPSQSGFLVFPAEQYPEFFPTDSFFGTFPILLPMLVHAGGLAITLIVALVYLPKGEKKASGGECAHLIPISRHRARYEEKGYHDREDFLNVSFESSINGKKSTSDLAERFYLAEPINSSGSLLHKFMRSKLMQILRKKKYVMSLLIYALVSLVVIGNNECLSLFAATAREFNGLGFTTSDIGTILLIVSALLPAFQLVLLPRITAYLGARKTLIISSLSLPIVIPLVPTVAALQNRVALWGILWFLLLIKRSLFAACICMSNIFINNSVTSDLRGVANGVSLTTVNIGRMLGPMFMGNIFSWSLTNVKVASESPTALGFPFNQFFVFYVQALCAIIIALLTSLVPESLNRKPRTEYQSSCSDSESGMSTNRYGSISGLPVTSDDKKWRKKKISISTVEVLI